MAQALSRPAGCEYTGLLPRASRLYATRRSGFTARRRGALRLTISAVVVDLHDVVQSWLPAALAHHGADQMAAALQHTLTLAYEPLVLPCSSMNCGDITYRSTLDPALRMEQRTLLSPQGLALFGLLAVYLSAKPSVLAGIVDLFILAPFQRAINRNAYSAADFKLGKKLASGGFGTVYVANETGSGDAVIVKKAQEFGEAEVWMNERMMRAAPGAIATFMAAFEDRSAGKSDDLWLVWRYEGDSNLYDLLTKRDFPYAMEEPLFGRELRIPRSAARKAVTVQVIMQQLLEALAAAHATGIVHRDIKPQNCIFSDDERRLKLIDWGAAADLRVGINYVPNEFLLDPRYAPPQQYIMSTQTPRAPPKLIAVGLSPILWRLNSPDRFDMWSVGVVLLQLVFPSLRSDNAIVAFNKKLKDTFEYDLRAWRADAERRGDKALAEGFEVLDLDSGAGWELLCGLMQKRPQERLSAEGALQHRWFRRDSLIDTLKSVALQAGNVAEKLMEPLDSQWLVDGFARSGTDKVGGFTEAQLMEELAELRRSSDPPRPLPQASATIAWWRSRQEELESKLARKRGQQPTRDLTASLKQMKRRVLIDGQPAAWANRPNGKAMAAEADSSNDDGVAQREPPKLEAPAERVKSKILQLIKRD